MKRIIFISTLFLIILIGLFVRTYRIDLNFPALYSDEVGQGYSTYAFFQEPTASFRDFLYKNFYLKAINFTWLFGLSPLGVRLPSAVYGTVLLFVLYLFARQINIKEIKYNFLIPFVALALFSFVPWGVHLSRIGHPFVVLYLVAIGFHWIFYLRAKTTKEYLISLIFLFIAAVCYPSGIVLAPLFMVFLIFKMGIKYLRRNIKIIPFLIILIIGIFVFLLPRSGIRGFDLAIWRDVNVTASENVDRGLARLSEPTIFSLNQNPDNVGKLFYNHSLAVVNIFTRNYLSFFSPDFLFLRGDPVLRHSTGRFGVLYPLLLPFLIYGIFLMATKGDSKIKEMFLFWIIVAPIPAAITKDGVGYLLRVTTMLPLLTYLSALGFVGSLEFFSKRLKIIYFISVSLLFVFSAYSFLFNYFHVYPLSSAKSFEYGFKEVSDYQKENNNQSMLVIWDGYYPHNFFRFWQKTDYKDYLAFKISETVINESTFTKAFNNLYFSIPRKELDLISFLNQNGVSYLVLPEDLRIKFQDYQIFKNAPEKIVYYLDKSPAFSIFKVK